MSEWKEGEVGFVKLKFVKEIQGGEALIFATPNNGWISTRPDAAFRSISPQPAPVDVSQIKVGDEVTVKAKVIHSHNGNYPFTIETKGGDYSLIAASEIASHTPFRPPSTLAEFDAMTPDQRERWFAEMVKGKVTTT